MQGTPPMAGHPDLQEQQPGATTSGNQLAVAHQHNDPLQDTVHTAVLNQAVSDAVNRLISQNWDMSLAAATQALYSLNIQVALHILDTITTTAPEDINTWMRDRAMAASIYQQQEGSATPDAATRAQAIHSPQPPQLSPLQISKQVAVFGRYPHTRPVGMLADADGPKPEQSHVYMGHTARFEHGSCHSCAPTTWNVQHGATFHHHRSAQ